MFIFGFACCDNSVQSVYVPQIWMFCLSRYYIVLIIHVGSHRYLLNSPEIPYRVHRIISFPSSLGSSCNLTLMEQLRLECRVLLLGVDVDKR